MGNSVNGDSTFQKDESDADVASIIADFGCPPGWSVFAPDGKRYTLIEIVSRAYLNGYFRALDDATEAAQRIFGEIHGMGD